LGKQAFDRKLAEVEALRHEPEATAQAQLGRALKDRSNYVVGKAAAIVAARHFHDLIPDLRAAFERFLIDPTKTDPQCWAKNALAKALKDMEHADAEVFLRGVTHIQLEAVFGGREDTAATLRGTCAMGLLATHLDSFEIQSYLTDLLNDAEKSCRIDAARAIAQLSARHGALPLRLKALTGDREPEVVGHCLTALLSLGPRIYLPFVGRFLKNSDPDVRIEAAGALAESREPEALPYLKEFWETQIDADVKETLLELLAGSPLESAAEFLLHIARTASEPIAGKAMRALGKSRYRARFLPNPV
jgi:HEAT repeat protein